MNKNAKIYVAGHRGLVGSALVRKLKAEGYSNIIGRTHAELDLCNQADVFHFFRSERPEYVILAAAKAGGIGANTANPADFIYQNLAIQTNVIYSADQYGARKLLFIASSAVYPKEVEYPIREEALLTGVPEPSNEAYAIAKIAGIKLCEYMNRQSKTRFITCLPTNLYGIGDKFDLEKSHVVPSMLMKFAKAAKEQLAFVTLWGSGNARRELLNSEDMAAAALHLLQKCDEGMYNIGYGTDVTIRALAALVAKVVGYNGEILWDTSKPEGRMNNLLDSSKIRALGWKPVIDLEQGLTAAYDDYMQKSDMQ
jgi:GDP-L-fucose synthase